MEAFNRIQYEPLEPLAGWSSAGDLRAGLHRDLAHHGPGAKEAGLALALGAHQNYVQIYLV